MNPILQNKLNELDAAADYECWYIVKQNTSFTSVCYQVSFLKEYQETSQSQNLEDYMKDRVSQLKSSKDVDVSKTHRALRVAAFFGLITMTSAGYGDSVVTDTFREIVQRCKGEFERTDLYTDIIQRQIEKMFISSSVDEQFEEVRKNFRLYPVLLLYKVLLELGRATGEYSISMNEYRYIVATTEKFEGFLETLLLIKLFREDISVNTSFEKFKTKFDNRLIQALKQLATLSIDNEKINLIPDKIKEVAKKVYIFEENPNIFSIDDYLEFLASTKSLFELEEEVSNDLDYVERLEVGRNTLLYGVPGSGKSWTIQNEYLLPDNDSDPKPIMERLVFHPDYTYSDFVGQILPVVSEEDNKKNISYEFTPGPFTTLLKESYENPNTKYILVIEEINRGNAPAIFGEIFQLLDRKTERQLENDDGFPLQTSEYEISNADIANYVYGNKKHKVRIPSNMSIIGTMNTSDQNVFTLDTAFQRRWEMRLIENTFKDSDKALADTKILDTSVTWKRFCESINEIILDKNIRMTSSEDKRLGTHFVRVSDLKFDDGSGTGAEQNNRRFPEKVIKYLWDDAFKFSREDIFEVGHYNSLEAIIRKFMSSTGDKRFTIFKESIISMLTPETDVNADSNTEQNE